MADKAPYISVVNDPSDHGGKIINTPQTTVFLAGKLVAVGGDHGSDHQCPITGHGTTKITPLAKVTYIGGKLVVTNGSVAGCGAKIQSPNRNAQDEHGNT